MTDTPESAADMRRAIIRACVELDDALDALQRTDTWWRAHRYECARRLLRTARRHVEAAALVTAAHL